MNTTKNNLNCEQCNKKYKSYQSLWNHNKKFHEKIEKKQEYNCKFCNKSFDNRFKKCYHQKKCEAKDNIIQHVDNKIIPTDNNMSIINNKNTKNKISNCNYIYLIEKYDINNNNFIYKFGKTNRPIIERMKEHCLTSKILLILNVDDCNIIESNILKILNKDTNIKRTKDIGNEYFYCHNSKYIIDIILKNL
jgi:hypothetical protein